MSGLEIKPLTYSPLHLLLTLFLLLAGRILLQFEKLLGDCPDVRGEKMGLSPSEYVGASLTSLVS